MDEKLKAHNKYFKVLGKYDEYLIIHTTFEHLKTVNQATEKR